MYDNGRIKIMSAFLGMNITNISLKIIEHVTIKKQLVFSKIGLCKIELFYKNNIGSTSITSGYFKNEKIESLVSDFKEEKV